MRPHALINATSAFVVGVMAPGALAQTWNTGPWDTRDGRASDKPGSAIRPQTRSADDVALPVGNGLNHTVTSLSGRMLAVRYSDAFAEIYASVNGAPAAAPLATLPGTGVQVLQTNVFGQYDHVNLTFDTAGLSLPPGRYWVSIVLNVSGDSAPNDGYAYFCTAGNGTLQGFQGHDRVGDGPWLPSLQGLGFQTDFSFTLAWQQQQPGGCYANCDNSTQEPKLNILDFLCFIDRFGSGSSYANCDGSTIAPVLSILDYTCFINRFNQGCP